MYNLDDFNPMKVLAHANKLRQLIDWYFQPEAFPTLLPGPVMLEIDPHGGCNNRCPFCQCWKMFEESRGKSISMDDWMYNILPFIKDEGVEGIFFCGGGEPTLNENLVDFVQTLPPEINICMTTNGYGLTPRFAEQTIDRFKWITVSVNAGNQDSYSWATGTNNGYQELIDILKATIRAYKNKSDPVELSYKFVACQENLHSAFSALKEAANAGFDQFIFKPVDFKYVRDGAQMDRHFVEQFNNIVKALESMAMVLGIKFIGLEQYINEDTEERGYNHCWTAMLAPVLKADGRIAMCCDTRELFNIGSWRPSLKDFWGSEEHDAALRLIDDTGLCGCPKRCKMGRYNKVVQKVLIDREVNTCFL